MKNNSIVIERSISYSFLDMYGSIAEATEKNKKKLIDVGERKVYEWRAYNTSI